MLKASDPRVATMGAIDPAVARTHAKIKSASVEASNHSGNRSMRNQYDSDETLSVEQTDSDRQQTRNNSLHLKAKKLLTLSPKPLKPSVSTSCLLTAGDTNTSNTLVCVPTRASLTHEWKKLKTPNKCRECNLLVYFNGRECSFCGFVAHKKCVSVLVIKCSGQQVSGMSKNRGSKQRQQATTGQQQPSRGSKALIQPIFGQPIDLDNHQVVDFVRRFVYEIDTRGLTSKGIYRVSSIKSKVDRLCNYYDQNLSSLVDLSSFHPNIIANGLKMYLRQLPEPLLTHQLYNEFIEMAKKYSNSNSQATCKPLTTKSRTQNSALPNRPRKLYSSTVPSPASSINNNPEYNPMMIVDLRELIEMLPPINRELISIIMHHLKRVADMSEENQMSALNLSIIFGPTLLSASNKSLAIVDNIHQARVIELMITWADQIFPLYENYESRAVIEIDSSKYKSERSESHPATQVSTQIISRRDSSDNRARDVCTCVKHSAMRNLQAVKADGVSTPVEKTDLPQSPKTREHLEELRRQFFSVPSVQPNLISNSSLFGNQTPKADAIDQRKPKSANPPGRVPLIEVQSYYCDTFTKCEETDNKSH